MLFYPGKGFPVPFKFTDGDSSECGAQKPPVHCSRSRCPFAKTPSLNPITAGMSILSVWIQIKNNSTSSNDAGLEPFILKFYNNPCHVWHMNRNSLLANITKISKWCPQKYSTVRLLKPIQSAIRRSLIWFNQYYRFLARCGKTPTRALRDLDLVIKIFFVYLYVYKIQIFILCHSDTSARWTIFWESFAYNHLSCVS